MAVPHEAKVIFHNPYISPETIHREGYIPGPQEYLVVFPPGDMREKTYWELLDFGFSPRFPQDHELAAECGMYVPVSAFSKPIEQLQPTVDGPLYIPQRDRRYGQTAFLGSLEELACKARTLHMEYLLGGREVSIERYAVVFGAQDYLAGHTVIANTEVLRPVGSVNLITGSAKALLDRLVIRHAYIQLVINNGGDIMVA